MATTTDRTLRSATDAARVLGEEMQRRVFDALRHYASHDDDVADAWPHVVIALAPVPTTDPATYAPASLGAAVRTHLANAASNRRRAQYGQTPTDPADMLAAEVAGDAEQETRLYWEDVRESLPDGGASIGAAIAHHLNRKGALGRLDAICASGPALAVGEVADALGMTPPKVGGKLTVKQRKVAREVVCGYVAMAAEAMGTLRPGETVEQHAARALLWVNRRKGSVPTLPGQALGFVDGRDPNALGPVSSLGYRSQRLAKTGGERRDAPVKTRSGVTTGLVFGTGEVGEVATMWAPGEVCPTPLTVPCGCDGACDCEAVRVCGCERPREVLMDGRGVLCHRERVLATTDAQRAKVASRREDAAEAVSGAYDAVRAVWDPTTVTTHRDALRVPDAPGAAYALLYAPAAPCPTPDPEGSGMCRCGARRGVLVAREDDGVLCHRKRTHGA